MYLARLEDMAETRCGMVMVILAIHDWTNIYEGEVRVLVQIQ